MTKSQQVTAEGLEKLNDELKKLRTINRPATVKRMAAARELGDLSENADYHDAREQLAFIEGRIQELESIIKHADIVSSKAGGSDTVQIGSTVVVEFNKQKVTYSIVGANEGDPVAGKISVESPVGSALISRKAKEKVSVVTPGGIVEYIIVSVA
jgi:transcription elongation factor GreA